MVGIFKKYRLIRIIKILLLFTVGASYSFPAVRKVDSIRGRIAQITENFTWDVNPVERYPRISSTTCTIVGCWTRTRGISRREQIDIYGNLGWMQTWIGIAKWCIIYKDDFMVESECKLHTFYTSLWLEFCFLKIIARVTRRPKYAE